VLFLRASSVFLLSPQLGLHFICNTPILFLCNIPVFPNNFREAKQFSYHSSPLNNVREEAENHSGMTFVSSE